MHIHLKCGTREMHTTFLSTKVKGRDHLRGIYGRIPQCCHWGFFSEANDGTMCPGVDSASKYEYQENSWE